MLAHNSNVAQINLGPCPRVFVDCGKRHGYGKVILLCESAWIGIGLEYQ